MNRILNYAKQQGYSKYTPTLTEAWRLSISGLSRSMVSIISSDLKDLELSPDEHNRVENYNQAWTDLFEESSVPGSIYYNKNSMPEKKVPWFVDEIIPYIRGSISDYTLEKTLVTKKGPKYFHIRIRRMLDISNKYSGMLIILDDLTELKKAEKEKIQKEKLEGVLEMAGAVCHEINQPLQVILGQTEILKIGASKEIPISENLEIIASQISKMGGITRKLMNIAKYETKSYLKRTIIDIEKASHKKDNP